ncbi:MAG: substrate-binding domain-containing protein [Atribacterota bacterium]|nr:substrate-binding domain-containing protein [Atribacterota bacterium]
MKNNIIIRSILIILALITCVTPIYAEDVTIKLATTTSTENSGLLDILLPPFQEKYNIKVDVVSVGTGAAIQLGENGDVDVVLVHAREAEDKMVADGYGINRRDVMYNDFIIVGPADDPAGIGIEIDAASALSKIASSEKLVHFVSRGDNSGTHMKELELWKSAGIEPQGNWYLEIGQGMEAALLVANENMGYVLADRGTYLATKDKLDLVILSEGDARLFNPYGIIAVNPAVHPHVKYMEAMQLIAWITSIEGQKIIGEFKVQGEVLFFPNAI